MIGLGIIGFGIMGRRMAAAAAAHPAFSLISAFDPAAAAWDSPVARAAHAGDILDDPRVDCIYVASPPATHLHWVEAAAAAGKPLFCEKPLAASPADARAAVAAVEAAALPAAVNFPFATASAATRLEAALAAGELGALRSASLRLRFAKWPRSWQESASAWADTAAQGGFTREVGSHFLFLAQRLFGAGSLESVRVERGGETETRLEAVVRFARCALAIDAAVEGDVPDYNRFAVTGTAGEAVLSNWYELSHAGRTMRSRPVMETQLDELARMLRQPQRHRLATFREAASVVGLVEAMVGAEEAER